MSCVRYTWVWEYHFQNQDIFDAQYRLNEVMLKDKQNIYLLMMQNRKRLASKMSRC